MNRVEMIQNEVVEGLEKFGPSAIIDLCLPGTLNIRNGKAAPIDDTIRDQYLARALVIHTLGDWQAGWKKMSQCPKCGKLITRTEPKTALEDLNKMVICDECLESLKVRKAA